MSTTHSPLRYPGGKSQLAPLVIEIAIANSLYGGVYAEPFAGGAGIAWRLLLNGDMSEVWINDLDPAIYAFWKTVVTAPDALCNLILKTRVSMAQWRKQRAILFDPNSPPVALAFAALFLNRTNRSGIIKGGVIGGQAQNGEYKLDCRFNKDTLIRKIQRIHLYRDSIKVSRLDAEKCLKKWEKSLPARSLVNIDPPYYKRGRDLYLSFYESTDHARLARTVRKLRIPWMLTYDDVPEIEALYEGLPQYRNTLTYHAQTKRKASELVVFSPSIELPYARKRRVAA